MAQRKNNEDNRLKQQAGKNLEKLLEAKFQALVDEDVIKSFEKNRNMPHRGFKYERQYLANFILKTLDDKYIVINSSTSFRQDRVKTQSYDLDGIKNHSPFSEDIIASILLYPDKELHSNTALKSFRDKFNQKILYSPASHVLGLAELLEFLENHKVEVELQKQAEIEDQKLADIIIKDGSYYGLKGNTFEKFVVDELNSSELIQQLISKSTTDSLLFNTIIHTICNDHQIPISDVVRIKSTNTIKKLKSGGNAKTDILIELETRSKIIIETVSSKTTTQNQVSCH